MKLSNKNCLWMYVFGLLVSVLLLQRSLLAEEQLIAAYNEDANHNLGTIWPYSFGWLWEAPYDFELTRIETKFANASKPVTIAIYDNLPQFGGMLLATADYNSIADVWGGADFDTLEMLEGEDYLISFWNAVGLTANVTGDPGSELFSTDGYVYYSNSEYPPPSFENKLFGQSNTIIRIYGEIIPQYVTIPIDIKPRSCPNILNVKGKSPLQVAICGSDVMDVNDIDIASLEILGVKPTRSSYKDVAVALVDPNECECTSEGKDGIADLLLRFDKQELLEGIGHVDDGDQMILVLTGLLHDGTPIEGIDCVLIKKKGKPEPTITRSSSSNPKKETGLIGMVKDPDVN